MEQLTIHQALHGYRDGHRMLRSSISLGADASRSLLVLSDMSGPSMQSGFEDYLTGYPLVGTDFYVIARTWYAPEMKRPGCVWTHSLLIDRGSVGVVTASDLLPLFRRPDSSDAPDPMYAEQLQIALKKTDTIYRLDSHDRITARIVAQAVYRELRPVIILGDSAESHKELVLELWMQLWPSARQTFSFCTGALLPRDQSGLLLDLQVVPRSVPPSQFRKSSAMATVIDLQKSDVLEEPWIDVIVDDLIAGHAGLFRAWLSAIVGVKTSREAVRPLANLFPAWRVTTASTPSQLFEAISKVGLENLLDAEMAEHLLEQVFRSANLTTASSSDRSVLETLAREPDAEIFRIAAPAIQRRTRSIFEESRTEGLNLLTALLGMRLKPIGELILCDIFDLLDISEALEIAKSRPDLMPAIVRANPQFSCSADLWRTSRIDHREIIAAIADTHPSAEVISEIVDAIITANADNVVEELFTVVGEVAVFATLNALQAGRRMDGVHWRSALARRPSVVLLWVEQQGIVGDFELMVVSSFVNPADQSSRERCAALWLSYVGEHPRLVGDTRVAAFGVALALSEPGRLALLECFFQTVYEALATGKLEYEVWEWMRKFAPPISRWREWDKCERIAWASALLLARENASPRVFFETVRSSNALAHVIRALDDDRDRRRYLKSLRNACEEDVSLATTAQRKLIGVRQ